MSKTHTRGSGIRTRDTRLGFSPLKTRHGSNQPELILYQSMFVSCRYPQAQGIDCACHWRKPVSDRHGYARQLSALV